MQKEKNNRTGDILNSLDNIKKAEAPPFFYTRLQARMEKGQRTNGKKGWIFQPVYAVAMLVLLLAVNAAILFQHKEDTAVVNSDNEDIQTIASAYNLNDNLLYDINQ